MAALWWLGMSAIALVVVSAVYFVWWVINRLFAPRERNHTVVYLKTGKGLVRKEY